MTQNTHAGPSRNVIPLSSILDHVGLADLAINALAQVRESAEMLELGGITPEEHRATVERWKRTLKASRL